MSKNGKLIRTVRRDVEWIEFELPENMPKGSKIKVLYKKANTSSFGTLVIEAPKEIKIKKKVDDNFGNR